MQRETEMNTNTKIIPCTFEYHSPNSLEEVLRLLQNRDAALLAGGTDLINQLKLKTAAPSSIVFPGAVEELKEFSAAGAAGLEIGALVPMRDVEICAEVKGSYRCLYEAINSIGGMQIRNSATIAGNIANASPAADTPPALIVLGAECETAHFDETSKSVRTRRLPVEKLFKGPGSTVLEPGEIITGISVPKPEGSYGTAFFRSTRVKLDVAKANCAVFLQVEGDTCKEVRVAAGAVAPVPVRGKHVEDALRGRVISEEEIKRAAAEIEKDIRPISDVRSTDAYRNRVMKVLVRDALLTAWARSRGDETVQGERV